MAPLAHTLALLAMAVATAANEVKLLDMAQDSFDDQYQGCGPAMTASLLALNQSKFQKNRFFAQVWLKAAAEWQSRGPTVFPLSSDQAIAIMAFMTDDLSSTFNNAMGVAGRSPQRYRDKFHYKTLHFLLTDALATPRDTLAPAVQCLDVFQQRCGVLFVAKRGDNIRFGEFSSMSLSKPTGSGCSVETVFHVHTCYGVHIAFSFKDPGNWGVLIPPSETFEVTDVTREGDKAQIKLHSTGPYSKYNCEWLKGGSIPRMPFHLGGLLLASIALAVATGIL